MAGVGLLQILRLHSAEVVELVHCKYVDVSGSVVGAGLLQILRLQLAEVVELVHCRSGDVSGFRHRNWSAVSSPRGILKKIEDGKQDL